MLILLYYGMRSAVPACKQPAAQHKSQHIIAWPRKKYQMKNHISEIFDIFLNRLQSRNPYGSVVPLCGGML